MTFTTQNRLRDLLSTADRQWESKSYDAAIDTYRTALNETPDADVRAAVGAKLSAAMQARDAAQRAAVLLRDARYHQTAGRLPEAYRLALDALALEPGHAAAIELRDGLLQASPELAEIPVVAPVPPQPEVEVPPVTATEPIEPVAESTTAPEPPRPSAAPKAKPQPFRTIEPPTFALMEDHPSRLELPNAGDKADLEFPGDEPPLSILDPTPRPDPPDSRKIVPLVAIGVAAFAAMTGFLSHNSAPRPARTFNYSVAPRDRAYTVGEGVAAPVLLSSKQALYTQEALEARVEGTVVLIVEVDTNGLPKVLGVLQSLDSGLDQRAKDAVGEWQYQPGMKDGVPVKVLMKIPVNFRLPEQQ